MNPGSNCARRAGARARARARFRRGCGRTSRREPRSRRRALRRVRRGWNARRDDLAGREHRGARARLDGDEILPGAKSVVCVARRYRRPPSEERDDAETARAHRPLRAGPRLPRLPAAARAAARDVHPIARHARGIRCTRGRSATTSPCSSARGRRAPGLGFVGKNGMLIVPGVGSMVLLGEVVTTLRARRRRRRWPSAAARARAASTRARRARSRAPFVLDPRRCVSYLTIEHPSADRRRAARGRRRAPLRLRRLPDRVPLQRGRERARAAAGRRRRSLRAARAMVAHAPGGAAGARRRADGAPPPRARRCKRAGRAGLARNAAHRPRQPRRPERVPALREAARRSRRRRRARGGRLGRVAIRAQCADVELHSACAVPFLATMRSADGFTCGRGRPCRWR